MNAALRKALAAAQLTETDVAAHLGVDPKTVRRWLSGQRPYPRHRWALADLLQADESSLWPGSSETLERNTSHSTYPQNFYAHRWQVPREDWCDLFKGAEQEIKILAYSALFIADDAGIISILERQAMLGVNVRIILGDPGSSSVRRRGWEEGIGGALAARAENSLWLFQSLVGLDTVEIRSHSTTLYNSIYASEKEIFVNHHIYGLPAARSPVIKVGGEGGSDEAKIYIQSFECTWKCSTPVE